VPRKSALLNSTLKPTASYCNIIVKYDAIPYSNLMIPNDKILIYFWPFRKQKLYYLIDSEHISESLISPLKEQYMTKTGIFSLADQLLELFVYFQKSTFRIDNPSF
jgi:hypothetical protein